MKCMSEQISPLRPNKLVRLKPLSCLFSLMVAAASSQADTSDHRSRIVESSLKDLSISNDAASSRQSLETGRGVDALGNDRVVLRTEQPPTTAAAQGAEVQSSLHRLRRETVSAQTADGRKARVDESLERQSNR